MLSEAQKLEDQIEAQNIITDVTTDIAAIVRRLLTGSVIAELLSMATLIKASSDNAAIIAAVVAAGVSPSQAPSVVAGVMAGILAIEAIINQAAKASAVTVVTPKS